MADNPIVGFTKDELTEMVRQILAEIPTSLPANGGNADTVDDYHVSEGMHSTTSTPPEYFTDVARINLTTKMIESWDTGNIKVALADRATNAENANNAGNAETVGGKSADDFAQIIDFGFNQTDTKNAIGKSGKTTIYRCTNWTDYPSEFIDSQGTLITINYNGSGTVGTDLIWCTQIIVNPRQGNRIYVRCIDTTSVSDWKDCRNGGDANTVNGHSVHSDVPADAVFTDTVPTSLPANGGNADYAANAGNADTLNGMSAETIRSMSKNVKSGTSVSSPLADGTYCGVWSDVPSVLPDAQGILIVSNYNTNGAPSPWSHRTFYSPHNNIIWHGFTANNNWYGWKEISTTPIKSVQVGGATDLYGKFLLWANENNKIPVCVETSGYRAYTFVVNSSNEDGSILKLYYISLEDVNANSPAQNKSVTATVYYVEI